MGFAINWLVGAVIQLIIWAVIIQAVLSWLIAFEVINPRNRFVYQVIYTLDRLVAPLLAPFRRIIPNLGGIDITPILLILALNFVLILYNRTVAPILVGLLG